MKRTLQGIKSLGMKNNGFSLVELIIVVAVVAILATITTLAYIQIQAGARDSERQSSAITITEALEKYYTKNGEYPNCTQMTGTPASVATLLEVNAETLQVPTNKNGSNAIQCGDAATPTERYQYVGDGSTTCTTNPNGACLNYTFRYKEEVSDEFVSIESRHNSNIGIFGKPVVSVGTLTYSTARITWTSIPNTLHYTVEYDTSNDFSDSTVIPNINGTALTLDELTSGTQYFVRVVANSNTDQVSSDTVTATPRRLARPTITASASNWETATVNWSAIADAQSYTLQQSTTSTFTDVNEDTIAAGTQSFTYDNLEGGTRYYYRLQASRTDSDSLWSATVSATQPAGAASGVTATTQSTTAIQVCWNTVTGADSYIIRQSVNSTMSSATSASGITGTCSVRSSLTPGERYYFTVTPYSNTSGQGDVSSIVNAITNINAPAAPSMSAAFVSGVARGTTGGSSCPAGSTLQRTIQYRSSTRADALGSWSSWLGWGSNTYDVSVVEGRRYDFQAMARCVGSDRTSANSATSSIPSVTSGISTPAAPTWPSGMSKSWPNRGSGHYMWYGTYCPSGTWLGWNEFHSRAWDGASPRDYWHSFGFNDWWILGPNGATVEYWAYYQCRTDFATSPTSPSSYDTIWVYR